MRLPNNIFKKNQLQQQDINNNDTLALNEAKVKSSSNNNNNTHAFQKSQESQESQVSRVSSNQLREEVKT